MINREPPKCPWCGGKMKPCFSVLTGFYLECEMCFSRSPWTHDPESAYAAAMQRAEPMRKPLTLEELKELPEIVWIEQHSGEIEPKIPYAIENNMYCRGMSIEFTDGYSEMFNRYQHTWRCWERKPTEEERKAAKWDDA